MNFKTVKATREGLINSVTSIGLRIRSDAVFVALPAFKALWEIVVIRHNGKLYFAPVLDVGPWNTADNDYVFGDARPLAEQGISLSGYGTNGAGIDLSDGLIKKMGINPEDWDNPHIDWKFLTVEDIKNG